MHSSARVHLVYAEVVTSKQKPAGHCHRGVITAADLGSALPVLCREPRKAPVMFCILSAGLGFVQLSKF